MNDHKRKTTAVILARARSGTTLLREVLSSHPEINCYDEVFSARTVEIKPRWPTFHVTRKALFLEQPEYIVPTRENNKLVLEKFLDSLENWSNGKTTIFDVKYGHLHQLDPATRHSGSLPFLFTELKGSRVFFIHVIRKNILATLVSNKIADANQVFRARQPKDISIRQVQLEAETLLKKLEDRTREIKFMQSCLRGYKRCMEIYYEEMINPETGCFSETILNSLSQSIRLNFDFDPRPGREKVTPPLTDSIANLDEIEAVLKDSPFEWMLR